VRRETGKEQMVRVHYDEGVAIHIGPESCAVGREAVREALTGECAGQPLSREKADIPGADAVRIRGRPHEGARYRKLPDDPARSQTLACADALCSGTGLPTNGQG
jgi:hypothetical protein